ncbi:hypothetical protein ACWEOZ_32795 [Actinoplanes sp. NPDC004185]
MLKSRSVAIAGLAVAVFFVLKKGHRSTTTGKAQPEPKTAGANKQVDPPPVADALESGNAVTDWFDSSMDRRIASQENRKSATLLLVTFAEAIAATLVGTALQVNRNQTLILASCITLGIAFLALLVVLMLDRSASVDESKVLAEAARVGWASKQVRNELRIGELSAWYVNNEILRTMRYATWVQMLIAAATSALAILSILTPR